jgi:hypothetical protein
MFASSLVRRVGWLGLITLLPSFFFLDTPQSRIYICGMDYNEDKVEEMVLALLHLTSFGDHGFVRAWKGHDWDALNRLHTREVKDS